MSHGSPRAPYARIAITVAAVLVSLPGCSAGWAARLDRATVPISGLEKELAAMRSNVKYAEYLEGQQGSIGPRVFGEEALPSLVADVLTVQITALALEQEFERRDLRITAADKKTAMDEATANAGTPSIFEAFPDWYQEELEHRAFVREALRRVLRGTTTPDRYYNENRDEFIKPCTRDIVVSSFDEAEEARNRILGGATFADVARDVSLDSGSGPKGGDLGCNGRDHLKPELNRAALTQEIGTVGKPIQRPEGYHLVLVYSREIPPLNRIESLVKGSIKAMGQRRLEALVERRFESSRVAVNAKYGAWDGTKVIPSLANLTPKPRPLPKVAKSSAEIKNRDFHIGQEVFITDEGFVPTNLVAIVQEDISFINETDEAKEIRFNAFGWGPTRIPPGDRATFRPGGAWAISYYVTSDPGTRGYVQVEPYFDPGDDPAAPTRYDADTPGETP